MQSSKRSIVFSSVLALLIYMMPNLVQDLHRISGHHTIHGIPVLSKGYNLQNQENKCAVCVFEFNIADEVADFVFVPFVQPEIYLLAENRRDQIQHVVFHYYNLRAPPQV